MEPSDVRQRWIFMGGRICGSLAVLFQLEVDVDGIGAPSTKARREGVDLGDTFGCREDGFVHDRVVRGFDDFHRGDLPVFLDPDPDGGHEGLGLVEDRCGLVPLTVEPIVDELVIPIEL